MKFICITWLINRIVRLENGCTLPKLCVYSCTIKKTSTLRSTRRNFLKSILTWYDSQIKSNDTQCLCILQSVNNLASKTSKTRLLVCNLAISFSTTVESNYGTCIFSTCVVSNLPSQTSKTKLLVSNLARSFK